MSTKRITKKPVKIFLVDLPNDQYLIKTSGDYDIKRRILGKINGSKINHVHEGFTFPKKNIDQYFHEFKKEVKYWIKYNQVHTPLEINFLRNKDILIKFNQKKEKIKKDLERKILRDKENLEIENKHSEKELKNIEDTDVEKPQSEKIDLSKYLNKSESNKIYNYLSNYSKSELTQNKKDFNDNEYKSSSNLENEEKINDEHLLLRKKISDYQSKYLNLLNENKKIKSDFENQKFIKEEISDLIKENESLVKENNQLKLNLKLKKSSLSLEFKELLKDDDLFYSEIPIILNKVISHNSKYKIYFSDLKFDSKYSNRVWNRIENKILDGKLINDLFEKDDYRRNILNILRLFRNISVHEDDEKLEFEKISNLISLYLSKLV